MAISFPEYLDHLVYTVSSLELGMDHIERLLGVRPVHGGRHPGFGTHNALLSLGPSTYLEIIAPDPGLNPPPQGTLFQNFFMEPPALRRWVLRTEDIDLLVQNAVSNDLDLGEVQGGDRETTDGTVLSWKLTDPSVIPLDGAVPFLIDWGITPHPAGSVPGGGELAGFRIEHPNPQTVTDALHSLGVELTVVESKNVSIVATIKTKSGLVELK